MQTHIMDAGRALNPAAGMSRTARKDGYSCGATPFKEQKKKEVNVPRVDIMSIMSSRFCVPLQRLVGLPWLVVFCEAESAQS